MLYLVIWLAWYSSDTHQARSEREKTNDRKCSASYLVSMGHSHQPTQSINAPRVCSAGLCCGRRLTVPSNLNLPVLGSTTFAEINAQIPAQEYLHDPMQCVRARKGKGRDMVKKVSERGVARCNIVPTTN